MLIFLRELPEPLIPYDLYDYFVNVAKEFNADATEKPTAFASAIAMLAYLIARLPEPNLAVLGFYMNFFYYFSNNRPAVHKMESNNLAICLAPTLLHAPQEDLQTAMAAVRVQSTVCNLLIKYYPLIFSVCPAPLTRRASRRRTPSSSRSSRTCPTRRRRASSSA